MPISLLIVSILIEAVADKPKFESRALRSIFNPKAVRYLARYAARARPRMARHRPWLKKANASLGHVSNVRKSLCLNGNGSKDRTDGVVLIQPDALLKTWRENYRRPAGHRITGYTHLHGKQFDKRLSTRALNPYPQHPHVRSTRCIPPPNGSRPLVGTAHILSMLMNLGAQFLQETLGLMPATKGANVVLHIPNDESLFDDAIEPAPGIFCTSPIITYLDLWNGNDRNREAAEYIAKECFPMATIEPQSANDYDDRTTAAVKSVLVEIGQILGSFKGKFRGDRWRCSLAVIERI